MSGLLVPTSESNLSSRKSLKKLSVSNGSKRLRTDESYDFVAFSDDHDAKKIRHDHLRCLSDDKSHTAKQKFGQDLRKIDKKSLKTSTRTRHDISKSGCISSNSAVGVISKIGVNSLKSDLDDLTKHVDELSLNELLNGTYESPSSNQKKGENASSCSENILPSVKKACSILQLHGASESSAGKNLVDDKDKCRKESLKEDSCKPTCSTTALDKPNEILERLALPQLLGIDSIIPNTNSSNGMLPKISSCTSGLSGFPWSLGNSKTSVDHSRTSVPRSTSQSKWVRIGNCSSTGSNYFSNLIDATADQSKISKLLQDIEEMDSSGTPSNAKVELVDANNHDGSFKDCMFPESVSTFKGSECLLKDHPNRRSCKVGTGECDQNACLDTSSPGENPQLIAAATTLYKIRMSHNKKTHKVASSSKISAQQKLIKDRKSTSSLEKSKRLYLSSTSSPFRTKKAESTQASNPQSTSSKISRMLNGYPIKPPSLQSQVKIERKYEDQQKLKKESKAPLMANGRNQFKDWSRRKSQ